MFHRFSSIFIDFSSTFHHFPSISLTSRPWPAHHGQANDPDRPRELLHLAVVRRDEAVGVLRRRQEVFGAQDHVDVGLAHPLVST